MDPQGKWKNLPVNINTWVCSNHFELDREMIKKRWISLIFPYFLHWQLCLLSDDPQESSVRLKLKAMKLVEKFFK